MNHLAIRSKMAIRRKMVQVVFHALDDYRPFMMSLCSRSRLYSNAMWYPYHPSYLRLKSRTTLMVLANSLRSR